MKRFTLALGVVLMIFSHSRAEIDHGIDFDFSNDEDNDDFDLTPKTPIDPKPQDTESQEP